MKKTTTAVSTQVNSETIELLKNSFPVEQGFNKIFLPRLGFYSQDQIEGKGKSMKVVTEAGTFYTDLQSDEVDENGKKTWVKTELGNKIDIQILFQRKQLKMYDEATELYTSSPIYDTDEEVIPLWCERKEVSRGTVSELKKKYQYTDKTGKVKSALEDNKILYVLYNGEMYQMNLRGSSMWSFQTYTRKVVAPAYITTVTSEACEKGEIQWNKMIFTASRPLNQDEADDAVSKISDIKLAIQAEKGNYQSTEHKKDDLDNYGKEIVADDIEI